MNDAMTKHQAELLAAFIASCRDWQAPGIVTALAKARHRGDVWAVATGALRAASDPLNRTPAVIGLDGAHWRPPADDGTAPTPMPATAAELRCPHCGGIRPEGEREHRQHCARPAGPGARARAFNQTEETTDA